MVCLRGMVESARVAAPHDARHTAPGSRNGFELGANDVTKLFRQFDSVAPRYDAELIRRDMAGRRRRGARS
ncbi:hypothetical protein WS53_18750 [Burkholderia territorii]|nr:hypothetical protein WS53_18750 [Burkholderia territorii]